MFKVIKRLFRQSIVMHEHLNITPIMTHHDISKIRNVGVIAHIDAGKTTLTERFLYLSGVIKNPGNIDDGDTQMDYLEEERKRGITIRAASTTFGWNEHQINLIDTPGHVDFTAEVQRSLRVMDGAITVFDGVQGVQVMK